MDASSDRILIGTRKGTFIVERRAHRQWRPALVGHAGVGVNFVARDPHTGTLWAALGHGHWGAKLSRSRNGGASWEDAPQISYPEGARYLDVPPGAGVVGSSSACVVANEATARTMARPEGRARR